MQLPVQLARPSAVHHIVKSGESLSLLSVAYLSLMVEPRLGSFRKKLAIDDSFLHLVSTWQIAKVAWIKYKADISFCAGYVAQLKLNHASQRKSELIVKCDHQDLQISITLSCPGLQIWHALVFAVCLTCTGVRRTEANKNWLGTKMTTYSTTVLVNIIYFIISRWGIRCRHKHRGWKHNHWCFHKGNFWP